MEINIGDYLRTNNGYIGKIYKISTYKINNKDKTMYITDFAIGSYGIPAKQITKHSKNLIDLIEVGDYVNGYKVLEVCPERGWIEVDCNKPSAETTIWENEIKTILTHEQFEKNSYKVEEQRC